MDEISREWELLELLHPAKRVCGRPKKGSGEPCRNRMNAHWAACHSHMSPEERLEAQRLDAERLERAEKLRRRADRGPLFTYMRWRNSLPDLSSLPSDQQWGAFVDAHDERCALCRGRARKQVIDHDHTTGLVRGLLCTSCNGHALSSIGHVPYSILGVAPHIVLYAQYPPAAVLGCRFQYRHPFGYDPAPHLRQILWHAGADGLEHEPCTEHWPSLGYLP